MSAMDLAAVVVAVLGALAFAATSVVLVLTARALGRAAATAEAFAGEADRALERVSAQAKEAERTVERADRLVGSAEALSAAVGSTGRVARLALATPVIKTSALATGARRAARRLRTRPEGRA